jgi:hypothetical protein
MQHGLGSAALPTARPSVRPELVPAPAPSLTQKQEPMVTTMAEVDLRLGLPFGLHFECQGFQGKLCQNTPNCAYDVGREGSALCG